MKQQEYQAAYLLMFFVFLVLALLISGWYFFFFGVTVSENSIAESPEQVATNIGGLGPSGDADTIDTSAGVSSKSGNITVTVPADKATVASTFVVQGIANTASGEVIARVSTKDGVLAEVSANIERDGDNKTGVFVVPIELAGITAPQNIVVDVFSAEDEDASLVDALKLTLKVSPTL